MPAKQRFDRDILALDDVALEKFVRAWVSKKSGYYQVTTLTGPGDKGRDVVGFLSPQLHEGAWHNYQCKQYGKTLPTDVGIGELGKILYYAYHGDFTAPERYYYVVPRGLNRNLKELVNKPVAFKAYLLKNWDKYCRHSIIENQEVELTAQLRAFVDAYDFERVKGLSLDDILEDDAAQPALFKFFAADPGPAPSGSVPTEIGADELLYVTQLLEAYGEREGCTYPAHGDLKGHAEHWQHLCRQRERFFDAAAFNHFYRDNTDEEETLAFRREVFHGIADVYDAKHPDSLARVQAVMMQAAAVQPSGLLGRYARVQVKQGLCHHFVNVGEMKWKK